MISAIVFAAFIYAPISTPLETAMLKLSTGDKFTYKSTSTSETDSPFGTFETKIVSVETLEVTGSNNSWFKIKSTMDEYDLSSDAPGPMGGMSQKGMVTSFDVSPVRKMKSWKLDDAGEMPDDSADSMRGNKKSNESNGFQQLILPEGDLKVGTKWKHEVLPPSSAFGGMEAEVDGKMSVDFTVVEFEGSGAGRSVVIDAELSGSYFMSISSDQGEFEMDVTVEGKTKYWVRLSDGVVTKMESESENVMESDFGQITTKSETKVALTSN